MKRGPTQYERDHYKEFDVEPATGMYREDYEEMMLFGENKRRELTRKMEWIKTGRWRRRE